MMDRRICTRAHLAELRDRADLLKAWFLELGYLIDEIAEHKDAAFIIDRAFSSYCADCNVRPALYNIRKNGKRFGYSVSVAPDNYFPYVRPFRFDKPPRILTVTAAIDAISPIVMTRTFVIRESDEVLRLHAVTMRAASLSGLKFKTFGEIAATVDVRLSDFNVSPLREQFTKDELSSPLVDGMIIYINPTASIKPSVFNPCSNGFGYYDTDEDNLIFHEGRMYVYYNNEMNVL